MTQADTVVPDGVQGYDRYAYVNNNPINATDPTGHRNCEEDGYGCYVDNTVTIGPNPNPSKSFDTKELFNQLLPNLSPADLRNAAANADNVALGIDTGAEAGSVVGTVGGAILGDLLIPGGGTLGGAAAGYVMAQTFDKVPSLASNLVSSVATSASILADLKTGETGISGTLNTSDGFNLDANIHESSNSQISYTLTALGWTSPVSETSLLIQKVAVLNDEARLPSFIKDLYPKFSMDINISIP
jgi:hypothetical protein